MWFFFYFAYDALYILMFILYTLFIYVFIYSFETGLTKLFELAWNSINNPH